jgi:hypothetical protein
VVDVERRADLLDVADVELDLEIDPAQDARAAKGLADPAELDRRVIT